MYVLNFALKLERMRKDHYGKLAEEATVAGVRNIFLRLAEQPVLCQAFAAMEKNAGGQCMVTSSVAGRPRKAIRRIFDGPSVTTLKRDMDAYRYALGIEGRIVAFLEEMIRREINGEAKALLMTIVEEERRLYSEILDICEYVAAPARYPSSIEYAMVLDM